LTEYEMVFNTGSEFGHPAASFVPPFLKKYTL